MPSRQRRWYTEPETFIAVAALVVSISAVVVGIYEASLQRNHDKAEVWPHLELATYVMPRGGVLRLENTGIGPAIVHSIVVTVDGRVYHDWGGVLEALFGKRVALLETSTVAEHALRAGDQVTLVAVRAADLPPGFWTYVKRIAIRICYGSVFDEDWLLVTAQLSTSSTWQSVSKCEQQPKDMDF
ncbi:MAG TPA: hypothetical protein VI653_14540 [Steroidobacteraceae bacterium]